MSTTLKLDKVCVVFGSELGGGIVRALDNITVDVEHEEFIVVLGASGCGKTTLLNVMAGFIPPTSGAITLHETPVTGPGKDRGVVFQKHALLPWLNVLENVEFGLKMQGVDQRTRRAAARDNLNLVGLAEFESHAIYQLSGGMQQRVGLARALTSDPEMLLMDEPLGALDAFTRESMQELILGVWKKTGKIVFMITHGVEEALFMATRLIVMSPRPGRITHEYKLDFCNKFLKDGHSRDIKSSTDFIKMREEVLSIIYGEEEAEIEPSG